MASFNGLIWLVGLPALLALVTWRVLSCPYTKVEESFTIQAVHDILSYGVSPDALLRYDHQVFPGAVPRSFIGPILLAALSYPVVLASRLPRAVQTSAEVQSIVRITLATVNVVATAFFAQACFGSTSKPGSPKRTKRSGSNNGVQASLFLVITAVQFHYAFWSSRTIPNSVALPFVIVALALICRNIGTRTSSQDRGTRDAQTAIWLLVFSAVVLRLEIVATIVPVGLYLLASRKLGILTGLGTGIVSGAVSVLLTVVIDTYFWQDLTNTSPWDMLSAFVFAVQSTLKGGGRHLLWPELDAIVFNVVEGKSSEWGVSSWHTYVTSLIPKLLAFTGVLVLLGVAQLVRYESSPIDARGRFLMLVAVTHVGILSMLGHKEWRFAFYVLPALNMVAAMGASKLYRSWPGRAVLAGLLALQITLSWFMGYVSAINYPGGEALKLLHKQVAQGDADVKVHIDVLPAMTGVTLFQSLHLERKRSEGLLDSFAGFLPSTCAPDTCWAYDKSENLPTSGREAAAAAWSTFTHLLTDAPDCRILTSSTSNAERLPPSGQPFEPMTAPVSSYGGLRRKGFGHIRRDLLSLPKAALRASGDDLMRLALPVVIVEEPSVWLCRRKAT